MAPAPTVPPAIFVLAGPNGGGKSSIGGTMIRSLGADYFNPDEATRQLAEANPHLSLEDVNAIAWKIGYDRLSAAIDTRSVFAFETMLGGSSITKLLLTAPANGVALHIWYVALDSVETHIARVRARVAAGGHDIPEAKIRARYDSSRLNLVRLLSAASSVRVFDNSVPADSHGIPSPVLLLEMLEGRITQAINLALVPAWAKPILFEAMRVDGSRERPRQP
jgi:predicted ABC-type ATPase